MDERAPFNRPASALEKNRQALLKFLVRNIIKQVCIWNRFQSHSEGYLIKVVMTATVVWKDLGFEQPYRSWTKMGSRRINSQVFFLALSLVNDIWHVPVSLIHSKLLEESCKSQNLCVYKLCVCIYIWVIHIYAYQCRVYSKIWNKLRLVPNHFHRQLCYDGKCKAARGIITLFK